MKKLIQKLLFSVSRAILKKYKPKVIAITGSIGKTSAKEAIFAVVSSKYEARKNIKNYNNEFGLPFTIIGSPSPKRNPFKWLRLFLKSFWMIYFYSHYPKVLVLELGIDRPGDMDQLMDIVKPDIAVLTTIGISHLEWFNSEQQIFEEKRKIFRDLTSRDFAILNMDDPKVRQAIPKVKSKIITYGKDHASDLRILDSTTSFSQNNQTFGTLSHFGYRGKTAPIFLSNILGLPHISASAAASSVGLAMGMELSEISTALANYHPEPGRMRTLDGVSDSTIIDDTYNAAPLSMAVALQELMDFPAGKKIAVLGDMLELGKLSEQSHKAISTIITNSAIDYFIGIGPEMKIVYNELKRTMFKGDHLFWFEKSSDAIPKLEELLHQNTVALIKGSQGLRMEKIVREVIKDKNRASQLLCRQDPDWLNK
jgi:UDP-N-acetylmuramoyl-tripeptide--D-alanyl-D-alanine ligase